MKLLRFVLAGMLLVNSHGAFANDDILDEEKRVQIAAITDTCPLASIEQAIENTESTLHHFLRIDPNNRHQVLVFNQHRASEALYCVLAHHLQPLKDYSQDLQNLWRRLITLQRAAPIYDVFTTNNTRKELNALSMRIKAYAEAMYEIAIEITL